MSCTASGDIVVIGAGLVGALLGYILQKKGYSVTIFERYGDIRQIPSLGRSINLSITSRGLRACDSIGGGLKEEILSLAVPVVGRVLHQQDGSVQFQRYGKDDSECNYSISRYELNKFLIAKAEAAGTKFYFGHSLDAKETSFDDNSVNGGGAVGSTLVFDVTVDGVTSKRYVNCACPVLACDGGGSRARFAMKEQGFTQYTETLLGSDTNEVHGYKEMLFPIDSGLRQDGLHIWPRNSHMLMALANLDGSMTGTLYMNTNAGSLSFDAIKDKESAQKFFETYYADALPLIGGAERAVDQMLKNPNGLLGTVRADTWAHRGRVLLLGDAAHAIVPFFGQGMNCGFEDIFHMTRIIDAHACKGGSIGTVASSLAEASVPAQMDAADANMWETVFEEYFKERKTNTDAIADLALENFEEMRDRVSDRKFLLQKKVENRIENAIPEKFRSGYAMVCYGGIGNVSYRNAHTLSRVQNEILRELIAEAGAQLDAITDDSWPSVLDTLAESISMDAAEKLVDARVVPLQRELGVDLSTVSH